MQLKAAALKYDHTALPSNEQYLSTCIPAEHIPAMCQNMQLR